VSARKHPIAVVVSEKEARDVFAALDVCINEGIGPTLVTLVRKLVVAHPALKDDRGVMATLAFVEDLDERARENGHA
jgi:hypothetical protein